MSSVSVIIPVYNQAKALEKALASIMEQTVQPDEVIIVDDGSVCKIQDTNFKTQVPHLTLIRQKNRGAPVARNRGFDASRGEYVIFWDADVVGEPDLLEKMVAALEKNPEAAFAYSNFYFGRKKFQGQQWSSKTIRQTNYIHTTSLIRRDVFPYFDESLRRFQDWDIWLTIAENGHHGVHIDEYLFHVAPGGTMSSWLPSFAYKKPWRWLPGINSRVAAYEQAKRVVEEKHGLGTTEPHYH